LPGFLIYLFNILFAKGKRIHETKEASNQAERLRPPSKKCSWTVAELSIQ